MSDIQTTDIVWKPWEKAAFRLSFIFFSLLILPLDWKFWRELFSINWLHLNFHQLFELTRYQPHIFSNDSFGIGSFIDWGIVLIISIIGAAVWGRLEKDRTEYNQLYYWLRVIVRFRLAIILVSYGFIKFFPLQMPYPSLSNLLTNYGDFYAWKIYFQTLGISPHYESFLGFVEILAAVLLFNRRTVTFGVGLIFGFIGNVAVANGFYDIGEQTLSTFIVLMAAFLFVKDIPRLYRLLVKEKATRANRWQPDASLSGSRLVLKSVFGLFVIVFASLTYANYANDPYKLPHTPGLSNAFGLYNVKQYIVNRDTLPYSKTDPRRWQDVVFEKWSTMTVRDNRPVLIDRTSGEAYHENDIDRNYELAGFAGRHYYHYDADTVHQVLHLQNKHHDLRDERLLLSYSRPNDSTILLSGIDERNDSIHVVLEKNNKKYMMFEGRRRPVKI